MLRNIDDRVYQAPTRGSRHDPRIKTVLLEQSTELTKRQKKVCDLVLRGMSNKEVASELGCSQGTAEVHRREVYRKLGVHSMAELAAKCGITPEKVRDELLGKLDDIAPRLERIEQRLERIAA